MPSLSTVTLILAAVFAALSLPAFRKPIAFGQQLQAFPRSVWPGRMLVVMEMTASAWLLAQTPPFLGHALFTRLLYIAMPIATVLILLYLDELLSARAVGGALLLSGHPLMSAARLNESSLSFIITVLAYILVVLGMILVVNPFRLRHWTAKMVERESVCRKVGLSGLVVALLLAGLALTAYR